MDSEKHWTRLRILRESGQVNMFNELKMGLDEMGWSDTWDWLNADEERREYYFSGEWVDEDN